MASALHGCSICGRRFEVKFSFQLQITDKGVRYYCGQTCHEKDLFTQPQKTCDQCGSDFDLRYAFQQIAIDKSQVKFACTTECREQVIEEKKKAKAAKQSKEPRQPVRIAVLNQKGGTGKTTTAVNLSAGIAAAGYRVLLVDLDAQGHVAVSLGVNSKRGIYQLFVENKSPKYCITHARERLHVIVADERLANVELWLSRMGQGRSKVLQERLHLSKLPIPYDVIILDCGPSISVLNLNALNFADRVLVPVSCDFLSLVGLHQLQRTIKRTNLTLSPAPIELLGILPTFFDRRNKSSTEAVMTLEKYFHGKVLPSIRTNTKIKEAPQHSKTIFEHAPKSNGARDYRKLADWVIEKSKLKPLNTPK